MKIYFNCLLFAFLLKECTAVEGESSQRPYKKWSSACFSRGCYSDDEFDVDRFEYIGDPIGFACYHTEGQAKFDVVQTSTGLSDSLAEKLNNGRDLAIFFHGIGNKIRKEGAFFNYVKAWSLEANRNICVVTYAFKGNLTTIFNILSHLNNMVSTKRIDFVAKQARDLVWNIRNKCIESGVQVCLRNMSQVDIIGFSLGAHVGSRACKYIFNKTNEKVRLLLGLDPPGATFFKDKSMDFIQSGDAEYVQVIHTSPFGIRKQIADVDIFVSYKSSCVVSNLSLKHSLGLYVHVATSTKRLFMIAEEIGDEKGKNKPNGTMIMKTDESLPDLEDNQVLLGEYGTFSESQKGKKFRISLKGKNLSDVFWVSINDFHKGDLNI